MGDLDLKRLKAYGDSFVKKLIYSICFYSFKDILKLFGIT
jgi:hypothetical protein